MPRIVRLRLYDCKSCPLLRVSEPYTLVIGKIPHSGSDWSCSGMRDLFPGQFAKPSLFNRGLLVFVEDPNDVMVLHGRPDWCPLPPKPQVGNECSEGESGE